MLYQMKSWPIFVPVIDRNGVKTCVEGYQKSEVSHANQAKVCLCLQDEDDEDRAREVDVTCQVTWLKWSVEMCISSIKARSVR